MRRSASGRSRLARVSVVVIRRCSNREVARLASMRRSCAGPPPSREPLVGINISYSSYRVGEPAVVGRPSGSGQLVGAVVGAVVVAAGVELERAVLEGEAHAGQLLLDLGDRLGAEVADVEQVGLAAGDELTHRVDALALEAVVRPDGELELLDGQRQVGGQGGVGRRRADLDALGLDVELAGQAEQL